MFQYAFLLGVSRLRGHDIKILKPPPPGRGRNSGIELGCFRIECDWMTHDDTSKILYQYEEPLFQFNPSAFDIPDFTDVSGYFQTEKYFSHTEDEVRDQFRFFDGVILKAEKRKKNLLKDYQNLVAIHVRRDDYVNLKDHHHNQTIDYYQSGIEYLTDILPNSKFVVVSDDLTWCKENMKSLPVVIESEKYSSVDDMCFMSLCDGHIIANSSFSWWGSYLANRDQETTVAPKTWFGPKGPKDHYDVYRTNWVLL